MSREIDVVDRTARGQVLHLDVEPGRVACGRAADDVSSSTGDAEAFGRAGHSRCKSCWRAYSSWYPARGVSAGRDRDTSADPGEGEP